MCCKIFYDTFLSLFNISSASLSLSSPYSFSSSSTLPCFIKQSLYPNLFVFIFSSLLSLIASITAVPKASFY